MDTTKEGIYTVFSGATFSPDFIIGFHWWNDVDKHGKFGLSGEFIVKDDYEFLMEDIDVVEIGYDNDHGSPVPLKFYWLYNFESEGCSRFSFNFREKEPMLPVYKTGEANSRSF